MSADEDMRRLEELAVSRLLEPLSSEEAEEYVALRARLDDFDDGTIERVVALAHLAVLPIAATVPRTLRGAVEKEAIQFFGEPSARSPAAGRTASSRRRSLWMSSAGWVFGLAASLLAVLVFMQRAPRVHAPALVANGPAPVTAPAPPTAAPTATAPPPAPEVPSLPPAASTPNLQASATLQPAAPERPAVHLESEWRAFLASHPHAIQRAWRPGGDPTGERVVGDVVWDAASQTGYMRFSRLRHNEPNAEQYQLWIFDGERDQRYPVDGGVFDVAGSGGEQIIPIHAKLRVHVPTVFAVTVEHPGGVVVSDRTRIAAIASVS